MKKMASLFLHSSKLKGEIIEAFNINKPGDECINEAFVTLHDKEVAYLACFLFLISISVRYGTDVSACAVSMCFYVYMFFSSNKFQLVVSARPVWFLSSRISSYRAIFTPCRRTNSPNFPF